MNRALLFCASSLISLAYSCHVSNEQISINAPSVQLDSSHVESNSNSEHSLSDFDAKLWDEFRFAIIDNNPDFDPIKHYRPERISSEIFMNFMEDDYTKEVLSDTSFDALEDAVFDGLPVKVLYVVVSAAGELIGTLYYFRVSANFLELVGVAPY